MLQLWMKSYIPLLWNPIWEATLTRGHTLLKGHMQKRWPHKKGSTVFVCGRIIIWYPWWLLFMSQVPGSCLCKLGFTGPNCDRCESGYRGYPNCEACPCNKAGSQNIDVCEGECQCKVGTADLVLIGWLCVRVYSDWTRQRQNEGIAII